MIAQMKEHGVTQCVMAVSRTWVDLSIGGTGDCGLEKRLELLSRIAALSKMVEEHFSSVSFVLIITAQTVDAEDHSMDNASKQPRWVA